MRLKTAWTERTLYGRGGVWAVPSTNCWKLWVDASGIAYGVVLQGGENVLEDQCWVRPGEDKRHINVAKLDAVIKGLNLASL